MTETPKLRPAKGARIRKPDGELLAEGGEPVDRSPYFNRLLAMGEVEEVPTKKGDRT